MTKESEPVRLRKPPPPFRLMSVAEVGRLSPRMLRLTFVGADLRGLIIDGPAASVRLLIPSPGVTELVMPDWNGNEFLLPDGSRPIIRTFTPRHFDPDGPLLVLDVVLHDGGVVSRWAQTAEPGAPAAVSGPGRSYSLDPVAAEYLLFGDESAIPAIGQLIEVIPAGTSVRAVIEVSHPDARIALPDHPACVVEWLHRESGSPPGDRLVRAVEEAHLSEGTRLWAAGEAAAMHRIRQNLFQERAIERSRATVRGYWKVSTN